MNQQSRILVAIDELPQGFWSHWSDLAEVQFVRTGPEAYQLLSCRCFQLVFVDLYLTGMDGLELLRRIRTEGLCDHVVLTSSVPSFSYAQQGILYGASAYLLRPLQEAEVEQVLRKSLSEEADASGAVQRAAACVTRQLRGGALEETLQAAQARLLPSPDDAIAACAQLRRLWLEIVNQTYLRYPWLKLYHRSEEFTSTDYLRDNEEQLLLNLFRRRMADLQRALSTLFPPAGDDTIEQVERFLLEAVDSNPQQKAVAERFYLAGPTLSIRFQKKLGISYRAYVTRLKLRRGEYLLRYTDLPAEELAGRLGYRDQAYFARLFLEHTGQTLSQIDRQTWSGYEI